MKVGGDCSARTNLVDGSFPSHLVQVAPKGDLFPGDDGLASVTALALRFRMMTVVGLCMWCKHLGLFAGGQASAFDDFVGRGLDERLRVTADPTVRIWLRRSLAIRNSFNSGRHALTCAEIAHLQRFSGIVSDALDATPPNVHDIRIARRDVDPLLREVSPPTYAFPPPVSKIEEAYPLSLFVDVVDAAFQRIETAWPELSAAIPHHVRLMVHVPDGDFRSASAARYSGVVFLSAEDHTVLEIEESIVHEFGHQILYTAMELDSLVESPESEGFVLPWSGSERDWYGYFHAFFIYVLLAEYLTKRLDVVVGDDPSIDEQLVAARRTEILDGIDLAMADMVNGALTEGGQRVVGALQSRLAKITHASQSRVSA